MILYFLWKAYHQEKLGGLLKKFLTKYWMYKDKNGEKSKSLIDC